MGSGKTTLGRALHGAIGPGGVRLRFVDLDEAVEQAEGATVAEIFSQRERRTSVASNQIHYGNWLPLRAPWWHAEAGHPASRGIWSG